jgi:hypothetical protein
MNESRLKKEFSKKDVQRMRNLITGNKGDRTQVLAGYEKINGDYKEGDVWQESDGRTWTIKNGIKQTVTKLERLKELAIMPLSCPCCKKPMKVNEVNKKMYSIHKMCLDCVTEMEKDLKIQGKYKNYIGQQMTANKNADLVDFEKALESWYEEKDQFFTEAGDMENWSSGDKKKAYEEIKVKIEELKNIEL